VPPGRSTLDDMSRHHPAFLLFALTACKAPCATVGAVCTVVGTGVSGFNGEGLDAKASWLFYPSALVVDPGGALVISDYNNYLIRRWDEDGRLSSIAGLGVHAYAVPGPAADSPLENAVDLHYGPDGALYVSEQHSSRILAIVDGQLSIAAGSGEIGYAGDEGPAQDAVMDYNSGVAVHPDGRLFIADTSNHVIREVGTDGIIRLLAGSPGENAYVDGALAEARFDEPQRMHVDGDLLYVADTRNHAIRRIDLVAGTVSTFAGTGEAGYSGDGGPAAEARLDTPWSVTVDGEGAFWVADSNNHVVRRIDSEGTIETIAGTGTAGGLLDGKDPLESTFNFPSDTVIGADGNLYVADMLNSAVREVVLVEPP